MATSSLMLVTCVPAILTRRKTVGYCNRSWKIRNHVTEGSELASSCIDPVAARK